MVHYTEDNGEMEGVDTSVTPSQLRDILPTAEDSQKALVRVMQTSPAGEEELIRYDYPGEVTAIRVERPDELVLEFDSGQTIHAHVSANFTFSDHTRS